MLEILRNLRREVDSLISALRKASGALITGEPIRERIQELFLSWSTNLRPLLDAAGIQSEIISRADKSFARLAILTSRRSRKKEYLTLLGNLRRILVEQILLEVARVPTPLGGGVALKVESLIPEIPDVTNELIPNSLFGWVPQMRDFLRKFSFDRNVFVMVAYRDRLGPLIRGINEKLLKLELNGIVAKDHRITDDLYNPIACLLCCNYGVAIFDKEEAKQRHNPNVIYELGMMQLLKRPCVILKHRSLKTMPTDLLSRLYEDYDSVSDVGNRLEQWWTAISGK